MKDLIKKLKDHIKIQSKNPDFLHHDWFIDFHLNIVEKIALELCEIYKEADKNIVIALVWVHDYGKILDMSKEHELNYKSGELLQELGFPEDFVKKVLQYLDIFEGYMTVSLEQAPIEVKIVSSADAASHMVGPFFYIYWKEYSTKDIKDLAEGNKGKLIKEWEKKIVLPEVKKAFEGRHKLIREQFGEFPDKFL